MRASFIALALTFPMSAAAEKAVSERINLDAGRPVRVEMDKGRLIVTPSTAAVASYRVKFVPDETRPMFRFFGGVGPSQFDYDQSSAVYDAGKGTLKIRTGEHLDALVTLEVPSTQSLDMNLEHGELKLGAVAGKIVAFIKDGLLSYDASALAPNACVKATINDGIVKNKRDFPCESPSATLHGHTGIISVK